jgi:hypothetical protein
VFEPTAIENSKENTEKVFAHNPVQRLTAFWAFSEGGFGGVMHITRLPFKGIFIAGAATLFISLIAQFSKIRGEILKSTIIVAIIKFLISPHTPVTAGIAVFTQGIFGELFFFSKKIKKILVPAFSMFVLFITAVQKIIIVTVLFGENLWLTLDEFANPLLNKFLSVDRIEFSHLIVISYITIHVLAGLIIGIFILNFMKRLASTTIPHLLDLNFPGDDDFTSEMPSNKKHWLQKPSGILSVVFFLAVLGFSFFVPEYINTEFSGIVLMILRALIIILLWYFLISPLLRALISKLVTKQRAKYLVEINNILQIFPQMKQVVKFAWKKSANYKGLKRIEQFIFNLLQHSLLS